MHESKESVKVISKDKKELDKGMQIDFLKRFKHLQELLKEIKDKDVKEEVERNIEDIKEEIENKEILKFDIKLIEETMARVENTLKEVRFDKEDYNNPFFQRREQRQRENSLLESTVQELAKDLPSKEINTANYSASNTLYGKNYLQNYESANYNSKKAEEQRRTREHEFKIAEETVQYGQSEVSKDIYNKTKIKNRS